MLHSFSSQWVRNPLVQKKFSQLGDYITPLSMDFRARRAQKSIDLN
jgi:hypothetical protein